MEVIKRSGRRQAFSIAKTKRAVQRAARDAKLVAREQKKLASEIAQSIARTLRGKRSIKAADLRRRILGMLDRRERKVAAAWRRYDRRYH